VSTFNTAWDALTSGVSGLSLLDPSGNPLTVLKLKEKKREQDLDKPYHCNVCGDETPSEVRPFAFGFFEKTYLFNVFFIAPNDGDPVSNIALYTNWRAKVVDNCLKAPGFFAAVPGLLDVDVKPQGFLDRAATVLQYDEQTVSVLVTTVEAG
jgi:hypothetical protein